MYKRQLLFILGHGSLYRVQYWLYGGGEGVGRGVGRGVGVVEENIVLLV